MQQRSKCQLSCFGGPMALVLGIWILVAILVVVQESRQQRRTQIAQDARQQSGESSTLDDAPPEDSMRP